MSADVEDTPPGSSAARGSAGRRPTPILRLALPVAVASAVTLGMLDENYQALATPLMVAINLGVLCLAVAWHRDGRLPVFDAGCLCVAATVLYTVLPFLPFAVTGLQFTPATDSRLLHWGFSLSALTGMAWRYVVYLGSFVVVYLAFRGRTPVLPAVEFPRAQGRRTLVALLILLALAYGFRWALLLLYGLDFDISYTTSEFENLVSTVGTVPRGLLQVSGIVLSSIMVTKQALLLWLMRSWRSAGYRVLTLGWLIVETLSVALRLGARTHAVLLLLSAVLLYDRAVRPIRGRALVAGAVCFLVGFLALGYLRGAVQSSGALTVTDAVAANNEFQVLFGTAYDVLQRKRLGRLGDVPWQVYVSDLYLVIPSQLLPFEKIDPATWYLDLIGAAGTGVGFMFGVITQAVLGFDWLELVARGAVLALCLAALRRWYVARASGFWPTLLYLFIGIWSYYTVRATTFWITHYVLYQFVPVMLGTTVIGWLLLGAVPPARREPAPGAG